MTDIVDSLIEERAALYKRIDLINHLLNEYGYPPQELSNLVVSPKQAQKRRERRPLYLCICDALNEVGKPVHYKELFQMIKDRSNIGGVAPEKTLLATLAGRKDLFARKGRGLWGLAEWANGNEL